MVDVEVPLQGLGEAIYADLAEFCKFMHSGTPGHKMYLTEKGKVEIREAFHYANARLGYVDGVPPDILEAAQLLGFGRKRPSDSIKIRSIWLFSEIAVVSWSLFAILLMSPVFREAPQRVPVEQLTAFRDAVLNNRASIEAFAKSRGMQWEGVVRDYGPPAVFYRARLLYRTRLPYFPANAGECFPELEETDPHSFIVTRPGQHLKYIRKKGMKNITSCIYDPADFACAPRPASWPEAWPYPTDPTLRRPWDKCHDCEVTQVPSKGACECSPTISKYVWRPNLELRELGPRGIGVRLLQTIPERVFLDEFVGRILPYDLYTKSVYVSSLKAAASENAPEQVVAMFDSAKEGNWARFINHSCETNCEITVACFGPRRRKLICSLRKIEAFEELTIGYSTFPETFRCHCGSIHCRFESTVAGERPAKKSKPEDVIRGRTTRSSEDQ